MSKNQHMVFIVEEYIGLNSVVISEFVPGSKLAELGSLCS